MTKDDDPWEWATTIANSQNHHLRRNEFTPYQFVLGKSPKVPTSLTEEGESDDSRLAAQSAALFESGPRRAEQIRAAANRSFFELDTDRHPRSKVMSRRLAGYVGWRGPCMVLAKEGHSKMYLSYRGVPVMVTPEQCRHMSKSEADAVGVDDLFRESLPW